LVTGATSTGGKIRYVTDLTVEPVAGVWKITGLEPVQKERLLFELGIRNFRSTSPRQG
jgi:hypothetical protein